MKLLRVGKLNEEKPAILLENDKIVDVSSIVSDYDYDFFAKQQIDLLQKANLSSCPEVEPNIRKGAVVKRPGKIVCIGLNFKDHAKEAAMEEPKEPVVFFKAPSALVGANDDLIIPPNSLKTDWEVELAVIIGQNASYVTQQEAMNYVFGYSLHNDYSERAYQIERGGQWVKGKSCNSFAPLGPFIATKDEIADVGNLKMWLTHNGKQRQNSSTKNMIFSVPQIISYLSQFMTLEAGDVISTGTPAGVGLGFDPPIYLREGDVVKLGIERLGTSTQIAKNYTK